MGLSLGFIPAQSLSVYDEDLIRLRVSLPTAIGSTGSSAFKNCRIVFIHKACRISVARRELYTVLNGYESSSEDVFYREDYVVGLI